MPYLPSLGMGTWGMGGKYERDDSTIEESIAALRFGFDHGLTLVDTAELYGEGLTEIIVGQAAQNYTRSTLQIVSKVWKTNLHFDDVLRAIEGTLKRLHTDYVDIYLVHWPNPEIPLSETMRAMERIVDEGLAKAIGVSNFSVPDLQAAQHCLDHTTLTVSQIEYNLSQPSAEKDSIPYCQSQGIEIMAYRPFAKGMLVQERHPTIAALCVKYGKTLPQLALNWIIGQGFCAIPKASSQAHITENLGALGWTMSPQDQRDLAQCFGN